MIAGFVLALTASAAQAQRHCLIKVSPTQESHKLDVRADCGSNPDQLLFAEGLQNTLKTKASMVGIIDYMVERSWELLDMEKSIKTPGTETEPPIYYTEFLFRKED
ncbi:MAG TPA: hypothetical protein DCE41_08620 [Cytophagales bacterium]|nr:hypothetical protein [Cytophagales bacterium]